MSVELALATLGTADLVIKYGSVLIDAYKSFKDAEKELQDRILCIEVNWARTCRQIAYLKRIWITLDHDLQDLHGRILLNLRNKLEEAIGQVKRVLKTKKGNDGFSNAGGEIKRFKYPWIKESLDEAIQDLQKWQNLFDPSWFLAMRTQDPAIDEELKKNEADHEYGKTSASSIITAKHVRDSLNPGSLNQRSIFLDGIATAQRRKIPFSTATILQRSIEKLYIVDSVACLPEVPSTTLEKDVRDLARKLTGTDPIAFGLLKCRGVIRVYDQLKKIRSYDFVFNIPPGLRNPQSLRSVLLSANANISLTFRFDIAQQLARSVSYIHTYGFVHKNVRPDTILIFESDDSNTSSSFLIGFEKFRPADGRTLRAGDDAWEKDLYRHPRRQGLKPEDEYMMQHDIYSLGVCMLEVGLWESFVLYDACENVAAPARILPASETRGNDPIKEAFLLKDALVIVAKKELPRRMGDRYTAIVVSCLTCLDTTNPDFSDDQEFRDQDDIVIGVRYIEKILLQLNGISV